VQIGQIHIRDVPDLTAAKRTLEASVDKLTQIAHDIQPRLLARGLSHAPALALLPPDIADMLA